MLKGEAFVIETEEVEDRRVEVVKRMNILHGFLAEFVALSGADARLHARARHPAGEAVGIVIAALRAFLEEGHAAKLRAPDNKCILKQATLFQITNQSGGRLVEDLRMHIILRFEITVAVPVEFASTRIRAVEKLHEAHATFDEATCEDAVLREGGFVGILSVVGTVELQDVRGLGAEVIDLGHAELHAGGEFVAGDARRELLIARIGFEMPCVHLLQKRASSLISTG